MGDWNERSYIAASRCWEAGLKADDATRKALERAATRYFWKACGIEDRAAEPKLNAAPGEERPPYLRAGESPRRV